MRIEDTLAFAVGQAEAAAVDPRSIRWLTIGLVTALQEACVLALSTYETAKPEDVLTGPGGAVASLKTLLRRVSSERYLGPPEKLTVPGRVIAGALVLNEARNRFLHPVPDDLHLQPGELRAAMLNALDILDWLLVKHPAHDDAERRFLAAEELARLRQAIGRS